MDVRMPDGVLVRNVPDGTSQEQLSAQYAAHAASALQPAVATAKRVAPALGQPGRQPTAPIGDTLAGLGKGAINAGASVAGTPAELPGIFHHIADLISGKASLRDAPPPDQVTGGTEWIKNKLGTNPTPGQADAATVGELVAGVLMGGKGSGALGATKAESAAAAAAAKLKLNAGPGSSLEQLRGLGYKVLPSDVAAANPHIPESEIPGTTRETLAGGRSALAPGVNRDNQALTNRILGEKFANGKTSGAMPADMEAGRQPAYAVYKGTGDALGAVGKDADTTALQGRLQSLISNTHPDSALGSDASDFAALNLRRAQSGNLQGPQMIQDIINLRKLPAGGNGRAVASALENAIEAQLGPEALAKFRASRTFIAQSHGAEDSLTGQNFDLQDFKRMHLNNPGLLTGVPKQLAESADLIPGLTKLPKAGDTQGSMPNVMSPFAKTNILEKLLHKTIGKTPINPTRDPFQNKYWGQGPEDTSGMIDQTPTPPAAPPPPPPAAPPVVATPGRSLVVSGRAPLTVDQQGRVVGSQQDLRQHLGEQMMRPGSTDVEHGASAEPVMREQPAPHVPLVTPGSASQLRLPAPGQVAEPLPRDVSRTNIAQALGLTDDVNVAGAAHPGAANVPAPAPLQITGPADSIRSPSRALVVAGRRQPSIVDQQGRVVNSQEQLRQAVGDAMIQPGNTVGTRGGLPSDPQSPIPRLGPVEPSPFHGEGSGSGSGPAPATGKDMKRTLPEHSVDEDTGEHFVKTSGGGVIRGQESPADGALRVTRQDTPKDVRGEGHGTDALERMATEAGKRRLLLDSDVTVNPDAQHTWLNLRDRGYDVVENPNHVNPETGAKMADNIRRGVYTATPKNMSPAALVERAPGGKPPAGIPDRRKTIDDHLQAMRSAPAPTAADLNLGDPESGPLAAWIHALRTGGK